MIKTGRRTFLFGLGAAVAAPAIVRFDALMPVKPMGWLGDTTIIGWRISDQTSMGWWARPGMEIVLPNRDRLVKAICFSSFYFPPRPVKVIDLYIRRKPDGSIVLAPQLLGEFVRPDGTCYAMCDGVVINYGPLERKTRPADVATIGALPTNWGTNNA